MYDILHEKDVKISDMLQRLFDSIHAQETRVSSDSQDDNEDVVVKGDELSMESNMQCMQRLLALGIHHSLYDHGCHNTDEPIELNIHWLGVMWDWGAAVGFHSYNDSNVRTQN
jgi:hypothetical protein